MGMDLFARNPIDPQNDYWRSNMFGWFVLWGYVSQISPTAHELGDGMFANEGHGPDAEQAERISQEITAHVAKNGLPENPTVEPNAASDAMNHLIQVMGGATLVSSAETNYVADRLMAFAAFCHNSRGFDVW